MIWYDMSYNRLETDFLNKWESELEKIEEEDTSNESDQTNSFIFDSYRCVL